MLTYSAQAVLRVLEPLTVLVGASYSATDYDRDSTRPRPASFEYDGEISYRGGLTYEFAPGLNGYLSYSESFHAATTQRHQRANR